MVGAPQGYRRCKATNAASHNQNLTRHDIFSS